MYVRDEKHHTRIDEEGSLVALRVTATASGTHLACSTAETRTTKKEGINNDNNDTHNHRS